MKNVLITGGVGFIGSHIALRLIEKGYDVTVLDNLLEQIHGANPDKTSPLYNSIKDKVRFVKADVCDKAALEEGLKDALCNPLGSRDRNGSVHVRDQALCGCKYWRYGFAA